MRIALDTETGEGAFCRRYTPTPQWFDGDSYRGRENPATPSCGGKRKGLFKKATATVRRSVYQSVRDICSNFDFCLIRQPHP
jgi:hypothetical protein